MNLRNNKINAVPGVSGVLDGVYVLRRAHTHEIIELALEPARICTIYIFLQYNA